MSDHIADSLRQKRSTRPLHLGACTATNTAFPEPSCSSQVYEATKWCAHLVHGEPQFEANTYFVRLHPVGITPISAVPRNEKEVACAVKGGLVGLSALHEVSVVASSVGMMLCGLWRVSAS